MMDGLGSLLASGVPLRQMRIAPEEMQRTLWMPPQASSVAPMVDGVFYFILGVSIFFFVLIVGVMLYFVWRYRMRTPGAPATGRATHNTPLELTWSIIPLILVVIMFYAGFRGFMEMLTPSADAMEIRVRAYKWAWEFYYPGGITSSDLHIPRGTPIRLTLESADVIHSFWVPAFRIKRDAVPGRYNRIALTATEPGDYLALCAEYCGTDHSSMLAMVRVYDSYDAWLAWRARAADPFGDASFQTYADVGRAIYVRRCSQCHTTDGTIKPTTPAPSFKNLYEEEQRFRDGTTAIADDNYIRESILYPQRRIVEGFYPTMPTFPSLSDREITALIEFIKELSGHAPLPIEREPQENGEPPQNGQPGQDSQPGQDVQPEESGSTPETGDPQNSADPRDSAAPPNSVEGASLSPAPRPQASLWPASLSPASLSPAGLSPVGRTAVARGFSPWEPPAPLASRPEGGRTALAPQPDPHRQVFR